MTDTLLEDYEAVVARPKRARTESRYAAAFVDLQEKGYAVVENVVSEELCARVHAGIKQFLREAGVAVDSDDLRMSSYPNSRGIVQHLEGGQMQLIWDVRLSEGVQSVFADMYGTNDLLSSTDGFCWMPKHYVATNRSWLHVDQSHRKLGRRCIQAYVNVASSHDAGSGSLWVVPGSHKKHSEMAERESCAANGRDWYKFSDDELAELGAEPVRVHGGVGSLVLWDSRTAHSNIGPLPDTPPEQRRERCVVYVCMQPRAWCTAANLRKKRKAFEEFRMTTHWPATKVELFPKMWQTYGKPVTVRTPARTRVQSQRMLEISGAVDTMTSATPRTWSPALSFVV
jgi:hypothetical protein